MSETLPSPEVPTYSRDQVLAVLKSFVERGITNPDDLPLEDPEVIEANKILDSWSEHAQRQAQQNPAPEAMLEYTLSRSIVYLDAGFSDPVYLDEVANDWLNQDLHDAREQGLTQVTAKIQAKITEINAQIAD